jgi:hypothetical protein
MELSNNKHINKSQITIFLPYLKNKTTLVAVRYQFIIQPYYLIKSMIFWSKFNKVIRLFLCDISLLLRSFCWGNKVKIRFLFSMFEHPICRVVACGNHLRRPFTATIYGDHVTATIYGDVCRVVACGDHHCCEIRSKVIRK